MFIYNFSNYVLSTKFFKFLFFISKPQLLGLDIKKVNTDIV